MIGLWISVFILWFIGCIGMLHFARFVGGGILFTNDGIKFWRFGKSVPWSKIVAVTVETQPLFSFIFRLKPPARRLIIYEETPLQGGIKWLRRLANPGTSKLTPHLLPSFQFAHDEFTSLFAYVCKKSTGAAPHSLDVFVFPPDTAWAKQLRSACERQLVIRKLMSVVIALGLVLFLGRRAGMNYFYNEGSHYFRQADYSAASKEYSIATKIDPTFAAAWDQLARSEFRTGDIISAETHWHRALLMKPDLVEAKLGLSIIALRNGRIAEANQLADQCARLAPHNLAVYLNQAEIRRITGDRAGAYQRLTVVEQEGGADPESLAKVAKVYLDFGDKERARAVVARALKLNSANTSVRAIEKLLQADRGVQQ